MSLDLITQDFDAIEAEAYLHYPPVTSNDQVETVYPEPPKLGRGCMRKNELCPGLE